MRWWRGLKLLLFMTCRDAAPLISHAMDQKLTGHERAAVGLHLSICPSCRRYRGQITLLRHVLLRLVPISTRHSSAALSPDAKLRIRSRLEREPKN